PTSRCHPPPQLPELVTGSQLPGLTISLGSSLIVESSETLREGYSILRWLEAITVQGEMQEEK
ncbi:hypothetical protein, partial [Nocardia xishanensis]|uniref:hypothetical protein n=1 Tax=Nocardia xishanensis TaxID=238964 RepID=UPI00343610C2